MELLQTDENYPFHSIKLLNPKPLQGGTYLSKIECNDNPIIFQTPKCKTKKGITQTEKKVYCDLLFTVNDNSFINWLNMFSEKVRRLILEKKDIWFLEEDDMTLEDIEYNWIDSVKSYKKNYLLRTFIAKKKNIIDTVKVYSDRQDELTLQDIDNESNLITILEAVGLKFSATSFHLEFNLRQIMVLSNKPVFDKCLIKLNNNSKEDDNSIENQEKNNKKIEEVSNDEKEEEVEQEVEQEEVEQEEVEKKVEQEEVEKKVEQDTQQEVSKDESNKLVVNEDDNSSEIKEKKSENLVVVNEDNNDEKENEIEVKNENEKLESNTLDKNNKLNALDEIILEIPKEDDSIKLKDQHQVYLDIYKQAREKAKKARQEAIKAYLTAKKIKQQYLLDEVETSDDEWDDEEVDLGENSY
tara:strand:+ start:325 stop:1560 length:1236 start_codon:yes stop_codon:yes gene_type:complete